MDELAASGTERKLCYLNTRSHWGRFRRRQKIRRVLQHLVGQVDREVASGREEAVSVDTLGAHQLHLEVVVDPGTKFPENVDPGHRRRSRDTGPVNRVRRLQRVSNVFHSISTILATNLMKRTRLVNDKLTSRTSRSILQLVAIITSSALYRELHNQRQL